MGSCESNEQEVESPKRMKPSTKKIAKIQKHRFHVPQILRAKPTTITANNKITDYITNNQTHYQNHYQSINIQEFLDGQNKFEDPDFTPNNQKLANEPYADKIQWSRPDKFLQEPYSIFEGKIEPRDIKQGKLGDCYLMSAIASISEYPFIVKRIFETTDISTYGFYAVWLFIDGLWECVVIDDYFPLYKKKPIYSRNNEDELWVMMIEKAYAKVFGSYSAIQTGLTGVALNALTGAPYEYLCKDSSNSISAEAAWQFISEHLAQNHLVNGSTENNDRNQYLGLISTHTYAILDCREVKVEKKKQKILKLSNPWGKFEWKGRWSQDSDVWTDKLRRHLHHKLKDDGIFWMNVDDFISNFGQICVCKYNKNYINTSTVLKFPPHDNGFKCVYLGVSNQTQGYINIVQRDHHHYPNTNYEYSLIRVIVMQLNKATRIFQRFIADAFDCDKDASIHVKLNSGEYYIIVEVDWKTQLTRDITVNFYGQNAVHLVEDKHPLQLETLFSQVIHVHQNYTEEERVFIYEAQPAIRRVTGSLAGYVYYHYTNVSKKNRYLFENVILKERNQILVEGEENQGDFMVRVFPGEERVVRLKVQKEGNSFYSFSTKIQFYIVERYSLEKLRDIVDRNPTKTKKRQADQKELNVIVKMYQYSGGVALLYQNKLDKHMFVEEINFIIENLQFENGILDKAHQLEVIVPPKSQRLLSFIVERPDKQIVFKTQVTFQLRPNNEKQ